MKPKKTPKPKPIKKPTGIIKQIQKSIDSGEPKREGIFSIEKQGNLYHVKKGEEILTEGREFRIVYSFFLKQVIVRG